MDIVGFGIVMTFVSMLVVSGFAVQSQRPPAEQASTDCPETGESAQLTVAWDTNKHRLAVETCDGQHFSGGKCHQQCLATLQRTHPVVAPSTVIG